MGTDHAYRLTGRRSGVRRCAAAVLLCLPLVTAAELPQADGVAQIVVTGIRPAPIAELSRSVTVITEQDIARSPATGLAGLLAAEANLNLRSVTGNDKFAGIDIRGSGDTFVSNVLVLVDGQRLNAPDLAGPDLAAVALDSIERIEIVRGANAVRYGSGAVGGVINIITRRETGRTGWSAGFTAGSFGRREAYAAASRGGEQGGLSARVAWQDADGYRKNGGLRQSDIQLRGDARLSAGLSIDAGIDLRDDKYGLPGPISREAFAGSSADRRASQFPEDGGETRDHRYRAGTTLALPGDASLRLAGHFRDRRVDSVIGYTPLLSRSEQLYRIAEHSGGFEGIYIRPWATGRLTGELYAGLEWSDTDYSRSEGGTERPGNSRRLATGLDGVAAWLSATAWLGEDWQLSAGYRADRSRLDSRQRALREACDYVEFPGIPIPVPVNCRNEWMTQGEEDKSWSNWAADLGLLFSPRDALQIFANLSRSFRVPNVDELALAPSGLQPQRTWHLDSGLRSQLHPAAHLTLTAFWSNTRDEILYGMDLLTNETVNLNAASRTERRGAELELRWQLMPALELRANAGYTHARFADSGNRIPLVADWTTAAALHWTPHPQLTASLSARRTGRRSDGNDFSGGNYPQLDAHKVADMRLGWQGRHWRWTAGVENLFDTVATASAYSGTVYPLASRSFFVGASTHY